MTTPQGKAAELLAAVRAVESGERAAASFFTGPEYDQPAQRPGSAPGARPASRTPDDASGAPGASGATEEYGGRGVSEGPQASRASGVSGATMGASPRASGTSPLPPGGPGERRRGPVPVPEELRRLLAEGGAPDALSGAVAQALGEGAAELLRMDPWQLLSVSGVRPDQADAFARALLGAEGGPDDPRRCRALAGWLLERAALAGHTVLDASALYAGLARHAVPDPEQSVREAVEDGTVLVFQGAVGTTEGGVPEGSALHSAPGAESGGAEQPVGLLFGLERYALAEESLADGLARLAATFTPPGDGEDDFAAAEDGGRARARGEAGAPGPGGQPEGASEPGEPTRTGGPGEPPGGTSHGSRAASGPSRSAWESAAAAAASASASELIRAASGSGLVAHTGGETARAEPAALVAAARSLGLRAYAAAHSPDGRARLAALIAEASGGPAAQPRTPGQALVPPGPLDEPTVRPPEAAGTPGATAEDTAAPARDVEAPGPGPDAQASALESASAEGTRPGGSVQESGRTERTDQGWDTVRGRATVQGGGTDAREAGGPAAVTVAGLLAGREGPGWDEDGALALDLLVVLDASQLDVESAAALVESLPDGARLVLSGDPQVLGAAGAGRPLADLLASRSCPHIASRTPDPGPIGELVSGIGIGELNQVAAPDKEIVIVPVRDAGEAVHRTVQLVADSVPRAIGVPAERTQVITPGHGGAAGTRALNAALKERLNPGPGRFAGFDPGDRVAHSPAPGRTAVGTVVSADAEGLHLDCAGHPVVVPPERVTDTVRHGWALTAHQAAGIRWPAVVVVLPGDAVQALDRAWLYTAFSRAERHLSVVQGMGQALPTAVAKAPAAPHSTRLRDLLQTQTTDMAQHQPPT